MLHATIELGSALQAARLQRRCPSSVWSSRILAWYRRERGGRWLRRRQVTSSTPEGNVYPTFGAVCCASKRTARCNIKGRAVAKDPFDNAVERLPDSVGVDKVKLRYKVFVGTRIAEIQELSEVTDWKYVNTSDNPADDLTRGKPLEVLNSESR